MDKNDRLKIFIALIVAVLIIVGSLIYANSSRDPAAEPQQIYDNVMGEGGPAQEQSGEKDKSILDIFTKSLEAGDFAPDFISEDVYGNKVALSDFRDKKPVLLVFWATWCGYCAKEFPDLNAFTKERQEEIQVIAVSSGESKETIKDYIQEENVNFLMVLDEDRKIWNQYFVRGTPSHFLTDKQGKIAALRPGLASRENLENLLTMLR